MRKVSRTWLGQVLASLAYEKEQPEVISSFLLCVIMIYLLKYVYETVRSR